MLAPENLPFAVALALLGMLVLVQLLGLAHLLPSPDLDTDVDLHGGEGIDLGGGLASLLGFGRVPFIVWLSSFLACFGLLGLSIQHFITGLFGTPFDALPAGGITLLAALPANGALTYVLGKIWPHDESSALPIDMLLGLRGTVSIGVARRGSPARVIVHDRFGQIHNVMAEPHEDGEELPEGREVLLVRRDGETFYALDGQGPYWLSD